MKLINRSKQSPIGRRACDAALAVHYKRYGEYGVEKTTTNYTTAVDGMKVVVEIVNRRCSYVATAMTGYRKLRNLPGQAH